MSSAILYVAIVAIWACVLIPRWLRRDQNQNRHHSERPAQSPPAPPFAESEEAELEETPAPRTRETSYGESWPEDGKPSQDAQLSQDAQPFDDAPPQEARPREPISREVARHRMLAARRRLLIMLVALEGAAATLTAMNLAALWVLIPPTVMLAGYLLLLREAAQADREQAERSAEADAVRERAQAAARARAKEKARRTAPPPPATASAPPAAPKPPVLPDDGFEDLGHGRDFAPGLAGKYTPSAEDAEVIDLTDYKRAVGD